MKKSLGFFIAFVMVLGSLLTNADAGQKSNADKTHARKAAKSSKAGAKKAGKESKKNKKSKKKSKGKKNRAEKSKKKSARPAEDSFRSEKLNDDEAKPFPEDVDPVAPVDNSAPELPEATGG